MIDLSQARAILELTLAEYAAVRTIYYRAVYDAVDEYLTSDQPITKYKSDMRDAIATAYRVTAGIAWKDGNGDFIIGVAGVAALMETRITQEQSYAASLFERLKLLRAEMQKESRASDIQFTALREAQQRADGYAKSLDYWYALVKLMALGDEPLQFTGASGQESCPECQTLLGTWHKASWYVARGYVPPRGENLTCAPGGLCEHILINRKGELVTI